VKRREFIAGLGGAVAWPAMGHAQQSALPVVGFLNLGSARQNVGGLSRNLEKAGYVEGKNVAIEYRWGDGQFARLAELAADLVSRQVAVIVAIDTPSIRAAKAVSTTIPIAWPRLAPNEKEMIAARKSHRATIHYRTLRHS
jgi:putative tryptophan/tyrosine transport system substrate-binding protein